MIRLDGSTHRLVRIGVEGIQVCADSLRRGEVLDGINMLSKNRIWLSLTCTREAPVSRVLFVALSGSPTVLLLTGRVSMIVVVGGWTLV
jgi:hypothetical protein